MNFNNLKTKTKIMYRNIKMNYPLEVDYRKTLIATGLLLTSVLGVGYITNDKNDNKAVAELNSQPKTVQSTQNVQYSNQINKVLASTMEVSNETEKELTSNLSVGVTTNIVEANIEETTDVFTNILDIKTDSIEKDIEAKLKAEAEAEAKRKAEEAAKAKAEAEARAKRNDETLRSTKSNIYKATTEWSTFKATAYTPYCNGCSGTTASGHNLRKSLYKDGKRVVAVDPRVIPLHSTVEIKLADGTTFYGIALDTGGAIKGNILDISFNTNKEAYAFGRQTIQVRVVK